MKTKTEALTFPDTKLLTDEANSKPQHDEIALFAYHIWEQEGRRHGNDVEHWLQAERQLEATRAAEQGAAF